MISLGNFRWLTLGLEVDRFDEGFRAFALVRLGEAHYRAAQRRDRSGFIVAVLPAKTRRRNQERTRLSRSARTERAWWCIAI